MSVVKLFLGTGYRAGGLRLTPKPSTLHDLGLKEELGQWGFNPQLSPDNSNTALQLSLLYRPIGLVDGR